jgi:hypothetical protein
MRVIEVIPKLTGSLWQVVAEPIEERGAARIIG